PDRRRRLSSEVAVAGAVLSLDKIMHQNKEFTLSRDCEAILIPSGQKFSIPAGTQGVITQALGGSYTIATSYGLSRIAEKDIDALGLQKPSAKTEQKAVAQTKGEVSE